MSQSIEQIRLIRQQTLERIAELTAQPKPTYSIDGQSVSWTEYLRQLQNIVLWCDSLMLTEEPCVVISQAAAL